MTLPINDNPVGPMVMSMTKAQLDAIDAAWVVMDTTQRAAITADRTYIIARDNGEDKEAIAQALQSSATAHAAVVVQRRAFTDLFKSMRAKNLSK